MHPPSSKRKQPQQKQEHTTFTVGGLFWKKAKIRVVEKKQKAKNISHGDFRLKIQTRFQSRHSVNIYSRNSIYTYTHIQNVLHWRVNHGWSSLVAVRLHREQRPLARFRMECVFFFFFFFFLLFSSFFFYPQQLFQCVSGRAKNARRTPPRA